MAIPQPANLTGRRLSGQRFGEVELFLRAWRECFLKCAETLIRGPGRGRVPFAGLSHLYSECLDDLRAASEDGAF